MSLVLVTMPRELKKLVTSLKPSALTLVILHLPLPVARSLRPMISFFSIKTTSSLELLRLALIAAAIPAGPPPIIKMSLLRVLGI